MNTAPTGNGHWLSIAMLVLWILCTLATILLPHLPFAAVMPLVATAATVVFGLVHGAQRYGFGRSVILLLIAVFIGNCYENLSISTGFPFGFYVHTAAMGPKLFLVPVVIGPIYFGICYLTWTLATMMLGEPAAQNDRRWVITTPIVATFIVVGLDLCADPIGATINRQWIYAHGGAYFGVPLSNYLGWFLTTWTIFQGFALYLAATGTLAKKPLGLRYWYEAAAFWAAMGLQYPLLQAVMPASVVVQDSGGWAWRSGDILQTATIMSIYTMLAAAVTSALIARQRYRT